jgi:RimJ/RimL family protein N-acetyltransferase
MLKDDAIIDQALLYEADHDPNISGFVKPNEPLKRISIKYDGVVVGFSTPRQDNDEVWRMGAIYIKPDFRRKNLGSKAISCFMQNKKGRAYIEYKNIASQKAYLKAGFHNVGKLKMEMDAGGKIIKLSLSV